MSLNFVIQDILITSIVGGLIIGSFIFLVGLGVQVCLKLFQ